MRWMVMKNKVLAILDSGVDKIYYDNLEKNNIVRYVNYTYEVDYDLNGHGTSSFNYIRKYNQNIDLIICKMLNMYGKASADLLEKVLLDLLKIDVDIISMPFSFTHMDCELNVLINLKNIFSECKARGIKIISSYENGEKNSFPANDDNIIGVQGAFFDDNKEYWYNGIDMVTNIFPECIRTIGNKRSFFAGNSKACMLATVIVIEALEKEDLNAELNRNSQKCKWVYREINRDIDYIWNKKIYKENDEKKFNEFFLKCHLILERFVCNEFFLKKEETFDIYYFELINHIEDILSYLEKIFCINIDEKMVYATDFLTMDSIVYAVCRWMDCYEKNK